MQERTFLLYYVTMTSCFLDPRFPLGGAYAIRNRQNEVNYSKWSQNPRKQTLLNGG